MKDLYPGYYGLSEDDFKELWEECLFAFDASALLNLYAYTAGTSRDILDVLESISERVWIPHQCALEYHSNRRSVIAQQERRYRGLGKDLEGKLKYIKDRIKTDLPPFGDPSLITPHIDNLANEIRSGVSAIVDNYPYSNEDDQTRRRLETILDGRIGDPFPSDRLMEIHRVGAVRYADDMPPGFKDEAKPANKYGDLVIWLQCIDKAKDKGKPIVFVTDDSKDDWWDKMGDETLGPHRALRQEMFQEAGVRFYAYRLKPFMRYAQEYLDITISDQAKKELDLVEKRVEEQQEEFKPEVDRISVLAETLRLLRALGSRSDTFGWASYIASLAASEREAFIRALEHQLRVETLQKVGREQLRNEEEDGEEVDGGRRPAPKSGDEKKGDDDLTERDQTNAGS